MRENRGPEVRESQYVASDAGPAQDTESYYKRTPAPAARGVIYEEVGERRPGGRGAAMDDADHDSMPGAAPRAANGEEDSGWISRDVVSRNRGRTGNSRVPLVILAVVTGLLLAISCMTAGITALVWTSSADPPPPPPVAEDAEPETWQGLRVKKGLR